MNMNIYISPENEKHLRKEESMSGLINRLLGEFYSQGTITKKNASRATPKMVISSSDVPMTVDNPHQLKEVLRDDYTLCKHGMDPELCKYAKPGQKCK